MSSMTMYIIHVSACLRFVSLSYPFTEWFVLCCTCRCGSSTSGDCYCSRLLNHINHYHPCSGYCDSSNKTVCVTLLQYTSKGLCCLRWFFLFPSILAVWVYHIYAMKGKKNKTLMKIWAYRKDQANCKLFVLNVHLNISL